MIGRCTRASLSGSVGNADVFVVLALGQEELPQSLFVQVKTFKFESDWLPHDCLLLWISDFFEKRML